MDDKFAQLVRGEINEAQYLRKEPTVGDRVRIVEPYELRARPGMTGVIKGINTRGSFGIEFDEYMEGHSCNGMCADGYGYWVRKENLEVIPNE